MIRMLGEKPCSRTLGVTSLGSEGCSLISDSPAIPNANQHSSFAYSGWKGAWFIQMTSREQLPSQINTYANVRSQTLNKHARQILLPGPHRSHPALSFHANVTSEA